MFFLFSKEEIKEFKFILIFNKYENHANLIYWIWKGMKIMFYWHWCCDVMWLRSRDLHNANLIGLSTSNLKLGRYRSIAAGIKKLINVGFSVLNGLFTVK